MSGQEETPPEHIDTGQFEVQQVFGPTWRLWVWFKRQFTLTSILTIAGVVAGLGGWALSLQTRVVVLETKVIPFVSDQGHLQVIDTRLNEHERRLDAIESEYEHAREEAGKPPHRGGRR